MTAAAVPCQGRTDLFFSFRRDEVAEAKRLCLTCPAQQRCLARALELRVDHGVWGGLEADERRALRRARAAS